MAFRIGRKHAQHSYPEPRGVPSSIASNFALGPGTNQAIAQSPGSTRAFTDTNGSVVAAGTLTSQGAPVTPRATGVLLVTGAVNVENVSDGAPVNVSVFIQVNGVTSTAPIAVATLSASTSFESIPISALIAPLPLNVTAHVNLILVASAAGVNLTAASGTAAPSTMNLQEVLPPTG